MRPALLAILLVLALVLAPAAAAQADVDSTLQPFAALVGQWGGPAWYMSPSGERQPLYQTEHVRPLLGGKLLLIEGAGRAGGPDGEVVFRAVGVISYDAREDRHYIDAFHDGHVRTELVSSGDGGFEWSMEAGGRSIRYVMRLEGGQWHETGHILLDGGREVPFVELTLERMAE